MQSTQHSRGAPFSLSVLLRPGSLLSYSQCMASIRHAQVTADEMKKIKNIRHPSVTSYAAWQPCMSLHKSVKYADALTRTFSTGLAEEASSALL